MEKYLLRIKTQNQLIGKIINKTRKKRTLYLLYANNVLVGNNYVIIFLKRSLEIPSCYANIENILKSLTI